MSTSSAFAGGSAVAGSKFRGWYCGASCGGCGRRFSGLVAIQPGHRLVTTGIYSVVRNPSYVGLLLCSFAWALVFRAGVGLVLCALMIPPLIARIHAEERLLASQFGAEYEAYSRKTWRLIPGLY